MANKKITQLVNKTSILSTDLFPIGDATTGQLYKKTVAELQAAIGGAVISVNGKVGTVVLTTDDVAEAVSPTNLYFSNTRARGAVSATTPLAYNSSTGVFSIPVATTSANGYLSSTDWTTFNGKENVLTFSGPLVRTTNTISIPVATTTANGYLSSTDWTTFNNKQGALTLTVTGSSGASTLVGTTLNIPTYTLAGLGGISATFLSGGTGITYNSGTGVIATTITQYTDALARASLSFTAGSGAYNSTTGVITIPTNTSQLTNGAAFITLTSLSGSTGISYNSATGAISYSGTVYTDSSIRGLFSGSTGISYNSTTGAISSTITQYTDALARGAISLTTSGSSGASTYNSTTGVLNIPTYTLSGLGGQPAMSGTGFVKISGTTILYDNSTYLTTASAASTYQTIITNPVTGTGTTNYLPKWTSSSAIGNSLIQDNGTYVSVGVTPTSVGMFTIYNGSGSTDNGLTRSSLYLNAPTANANVIRFSGAIATDLIFGRFGNYDGLSVGTTSGTEIARFTSGGNLGLGATPSAWASAFTAFQGGAYNSAITFQNNDLDISLWNNSYFNGTNSIYIASGSAARFRVNNNTFQWLNAPSGTAGTSVTFTQAMTLASTGNLLVGTSTDSGYKLDVNGTGRFSGTVSNLNNLIYSGGSLFLRNPANTFDWALYQDSSNNLKTDFNGSTKLTIASGGAATFSSSVTATNLLTTSMSGSAINIRGDETLNSNFGITWTTPTYTGGIAAIRVARTGATDAANMMFFTSPNGDVPNERMRITSGGLVAIGISSNLGGGNLEVLSNGTSAFTARSASTSTSNGGTTVVSVRSVDASAGYWANAQYNAWQHIFGVSGSTEAMRITSGGSVGIGTSSPGYKLSISSTTNGDGVYYTDGTVGSWLGSLSSTSTIGATTNHPLAFYTNGTDRGRITAGGNWLLGTSTDNGEKLYISGNVRATGTITANSDIRLKKNLERIENALEKVGQISGYTYDTIYDDKRHGGVIAQEIDEVFPEIVNKGNDGLLGVEYGNISALLIEALKELKEKNTALEARLQALEK